MKEVVLDTETTGISVKEGHRIVEIGCIELENLIPTKKKFHCYLNPERKVYINLIDQKEPTLNFNNQNEKSMMRKSENILYFKKVVKLSKEELTKHSNYLKKDLKKNFFN